MNKFYFDYLIDKTRPEFKDKEADRILVGATDMAIAEKLQQKREGGRGGWWQDDCDWETLMEMAKDHMSRCDKDPHQIIDTINLLAMVRIKQQWEQEEPNNDTRG